MRSWKREDESTVYSPRLSRGIGVPNDRDRQRFLDRLADCVEAHEVRLYMFCLMSNHFHLMLETPAAADKVLFAAARQEHSRPAPQRPPLF